jgi:hypothetical protein
MAHSKTDIALYRVSNRVGKRNRRRNALVPIQQRRLSEIPRHVLRVECLRCFRIVEIQKADAVRLFGPHAVYKDVGQALLDDGCQHRTGSPREGRVGLNPFGAFQQLCEQADERDEFQGPFRIIFDEAVRPGISQSGHRP